MGGAVNTSEGEEDQQNAVVFRSLELALKKSIFSDFGPEIIEELHLGEEIEKLFQREGNCVGMNADDTPLLNLSLVDDVTSECICQFCFKNENFESRPFLFQHRISICRNVVSFSEQQEILFQKVVNDLKAETENKKIEFLRIFSQELTNFLVAIFNFIRDQSLSHPIEKENIPISVTSLYEAISQNIINLVTPSLLLKISLSNTLSSSEVLEWIIPSEISPCDEEVSYLLNNLLSLVFPYQGVKQAIFDSLSKKFEENLTIHIILSNYYIATMNALQQDVKFFDEKVQNGFITNYFRKLAERIENEFDIFDLSGDDSEVLEFTGEICQRVDSIFLDYDQYYLSFAGSPGGLESLVDLIASIHYVDYFDIKKKDYLTSNVESMDNLLQKESFILELLNSFIKRIITHPSREESLLKIGKLLIKKIEKFNRRVISQSYRYVSPLIALDRAFIIVVIALASFEGSNPHEQQDNTNKFMNKKVTLEGLTEVFDKLFDPLPKSKVVSVTQFFNVQLSEVFHTIGFFKEIYRKVWAKFGDDEFQDIYTHYGASNLLFSSCDTAFIQIGINFATKKGLNEMLESFASSHNFYKVASYSFDIFTELFQKDWFEKQCLLVNDFWGVMMIILTSSISVSNVILRILPKRILNELRDFEIAQKKYKFLEPINNIIRQVVFCLGSCNAKKMNSICSDYVDECLPLFPYLEGLLNYRQESYIFRLKIDDQKVMKSRLNCEELNKKETSVADLFSQLSNQGVRPSTHLSEDSSTYYDFIQKSTINTLQNIYFDVMCRRFTKFTEPNDSIVHSSKLFLKVSCLFLDRLKEKKVEEDGRKLKMNKKWKQFWKSHFAFQYSKIDFDDEGYSRLLKLVTSKIDGLFDDKIEARGKGQKQSIGGDSNLEEGEKSGNGVGDLADENELKQDGVDLGEVKKKKKVKKISKKKKNGILKKMKEKKLKLLEKFKNDIEEPSPKDPIPSPNQEEDSNLNQKNITPTSNLPLKTCSYCLSSIETNQSMILPICLKVKKSTDSNICYPFITTCGHGLHLRCFQEMNIYKTKIKIWFNQTECLRCRTITNSFIQDEGDKIVMDYVVQTYKEQIGFMSAARQESGLNFNMDPFTIFYKLWKFLVSQRRVLSLRNMEVNYFDAYRLILKRLQYLMANSGWEMQDEQFKQQIQGFMGVVEAAEGSDDILQRVSVLIVKRFDQKSKNLELISEIRDIIFDKDDISQISQYINSGIPLPQNEEQDDSLEPNFLNKIMLFVSILLFVDQDFQYCLSESDQISQKNLTGVENSGLFKIVSKVKDSTLEDNIMMDRDLLTQLFAPYMDLGGLEESEQKKLAIKNLENATQFYELPHKYVDLVFKFLQEGCSFCNNWPETQKHDSLLCLLCSVHLCYPNCDLGMDNHDQFKNISNPAAHSILAHSGTCMYLSIFKSNLYLVEFPLCKCYFICFFSFKSSSSS